MSATTERTRAATSARRPHHPATRRTWFLANSEYRRYALREASSLAVGLFVLDLLVGLVAVQRGPQGWQWWVQLQTHPVGVVATALAILLSFVHAATWFSATPAIVRVRCGRRYLPRPWLIGLQYVLLAGFAVLVVGWLGGVW